MASALKLIWAPVPVIIVVNVYFFRLVLRKASRLCGAESNWVVPKEGLSGGDVLVFVFPLSMACS